MTVAVSLSEPIEEIYDATEVRRLFDRMSATYDRMNLIASLGFAALWRRQLLTLARPTSAPRAVLDLMSGRGETWAAIQRRFPEASLTALDFSERMVEQSERRNHSAFGGHVTVRHEDALCSTIPDDSVDVVVSAYGLKTFDDAQSERLAAEVARILRPGGTFAFIDVTEPANGLFRLVYGANLRWIVPLAGILLLSDPSEYRMLHRYLSAYGDGMRSIEAFGRQASLRVEVRRHFFGCATSISGVKAELDTAHRLVSA